MPDNMYGYGSSAPYTFTNYQNVPSTNDPVGSGNPLYGTGFLNLDRFINDRNLGYGKAQDIPLTFDTTKDYTEQTDPEFNNWIAWKGHQGAQGYQPGIGPAGIDRMTGLPTYTGNGGVFDWARPAKYGSLGTQQISYNDWKDNKSLADINPNLAAAGARLGNWQTGGTYDPNDPFKNFSGMASTWSGPTTFPGMPNNLPGGVAASTGGGAEGVPSSPTGMAGSSIPGNSYIDIGNMPTGPTAAQLGKGPMTAQSLSKGMSQSPMPGYDATKNTNIEPGVFPALGLYLAPWTATGLSTERINNPPKPGQPAIPVTGRTW